MRTKRIFFPPKTLYHCTILALLGVTITLLPKSAEAQNVKDGKIFAVYTIDFNGIPLGKFKFRSDVGEKQYSMSANSKFTFLDGLLFKWKGSVYSSGKISKKGPRPDKFSYRSETNSKVETITMKFANNAVAKAVRQPPKKPSKKAIPIQKHHLENVIDPMSALMVLTEFSSSAASEKDICNRNMSIFDGQQRFDIFLSYKRKDRVEKSAGSGFSPTAYVCKVRYRPVAGYKPNKSGIKYMAESNDIEVWLVPVRKAKMYVPYRIVLPTIAGYASASVRKFEIDQPGQARLAYNNR